MSDEKKSSSDSSSRQSRPQRRYQGRRQARYYQSRRKVPPIKIEEVDWKNVKGLRYFLTDQGAIRSPRKTGANAKLQRRVATAIKRARQMALLPFTGEHIRITTGRLGSDLPDFRPQNRQISTESETIETSGE